MKIGLTEIILLYDNNAPLPSFEKQARKACSDFISAMNKSGADINITFANFGNGYKLNIDNAPIGSVRLSSKNFTTNGTRDIFDSIGVSLHEKGIKFNNTDYNEHPENIIFVLITFGKDNASKSYTYKRIADMIKHQHEVYKWSFFCLANKHAIPNQLGIPADNVIWLDTEHMQIPAHPEHTQSHNSADFLINALSKLEERIKGIVFK